MPIYCYKCLVCAACDDRVAGVDHDTACCLLCRGVMLRRDVDIFKPYFREDDSRLCPGTASGSRK